MLLSDWPRGFVCVGKMGLDVGFPKSGFSMFSMFSRIGSDFASIMVDFRPGA